MWMRPLKTYTKQEMAYVLGCSPRTIEEDAKHLNIVPAKGDRNANLYTERDFNLISQMREHCSNKQNSRDSFVPITVPELVEDEVKITKLNQSDSSNSVDNLKDSIERGSLGGSPAQRQVSFEIGLSHDPFFDLELLQRISDRKWLIPSDRLAPLFRITPKYLNTKHQYNYCGFIAKREIYANNRIFWKVEKRQ